MRKFMVKNSNKPCDKECFVDTRMFPSNAACANHANPWERHRTTLGGVASLEFEGAEA